VRIDSSELIGEAFQWCRMGATTQAVPLLDAARCLVETVRATRRLDHDSGEPSVARVLASTDPDQWQAVHDARPLPDDAGVLLDTIAAALDNLRELAPRGERLAMRNLGYAFHSLPGMLGAPATFKRDLYAFSLRFIAFHWALVSSELRLALAHLLRVTPDRLEAKVTGEGFARSMYSE
jgi:hypothetical protein